VGCRDRMPTTALLATGPFAGRLRAPTVAAAIARGLVQGGLPAPEQCPLDDHQSSSAAVRAYLDALGVDTRMRRARAVVLGVGRLQAHLLAGSAAFEIATRARQAGVPAYAVTAENRLSPFDARMLDLQVIIEAGSTKALTAAGERLAELL
jgi:hypothetical protein